jgi:ubiquinone/menaquinone biosynthesis C-methylase UbiE
MTLSAILQKALWAAYAQTYDGLNDFEPYSKLVKDVTGEINPTEGSRILDLGCGTGNQLLVFAGMSSLKLIGVDASGAMLAQARKKLRRAKASVAFYNEDVLSFLSEAPTASVDFAMSTNVVYALKQRDSFWKELFRVTKPGGIIVIATSVSTDTKQLLTDHLRSKGLRGLIHPRLIGVFLIDQLINVFGRTGVFEFPRKELILSEISRAGGEVIQSMPCYSGTGIILTVKR